MIIVSDTSPINYLVLIGEIEVLQKLAVQVIIPQAVYVDALLLDDRDGTKEVRKQNIPTLSTFGILEEAANKTLLDLSDQSSP
jgi:predicted nucleic acid-binding protein